MFAKRTNWKLDQNKISYCLGRLEQSGIQVLDLTESNPTHCKFDYLNDNFLTPFANPKNLCYNPSPRGTKAAREAIMTYYKKKGFSVNPDQIFLTASTSEAYSFLMRLLVNPGEQILVPKPGYPLFDFLADLNDVQQSYYSLAYRDSEWQIQFDSLKNLDKQNIKTMIVVNPNNPTGSFLKRNELNELNKAAQEHNFALISDEVFLDYSINKKQERVESLVQNSKALTFVLSGISKVMALPQMKLGWIVANGPKPILTQALERLEVIADTYLSVNTPAQNALPDWLQSEETIQNQIRERIQENYQYAFRITQNKPEVTLLQLEGGWYLTVKMTRSLDEEKLTLELLENDHVLIHPGYFFDFPDEGYFILSLIVPTGIFKKGLERFLNRLCSTNA